MRKTKTPPLGGGVQPSSILLSNPVESNPLEVEIGVGIAGHALVALGMYDLLHLMVDEVVEGVDVLADQAPHPQEGRQQLVLVLHLLDRLGELGRVAVVDAGIAQHAVRGAGIDNLGTAPLGHRHGVMALQTSGLSACCRHLCFVVDTF